MGIKDNFITMQEYAKKVSCKKDYFQGRPKIDIDTKIDGGVYLGVNPREALVVDFDNSNCLRTLFNVACSRANDGKIGEVYEHLQSVYQITREAFPLGGEKRVNEFIKERGFEDNVKVNLDVFIANGIGVCRHMALTSGVLLEKFIDMGFIDGKVSVDRNETIFERHAWARYTESNGNVTIVDPALSYFGKPLTPTLRHRWDYRRHEDFK